MADATDVAVEILKANKNFQDTKGNSLVMLTPQGIQIDIHPFRSVEINVEGGG